MNLVANSNRSRGEKRRIKTRSAILDAAEDAFTELGYRGTRMEDISENADVAIGSIYSHFGSKDGLYSALVERAVELFASYLEAAYNPDWSPLEQVIACGDAYLRFHIEHPGAFRFLAFNGVETGTPLIDPELSARIDAKVAVIVEQFEATVRQAIDAGEIRSSVDPELISRFLWGAWNGTVALGLRNDSFFLSEDRIEMAIQQARRVVLEGLSAVGFRDVDGNSRAELRTVDSPRPE
ncbi:MAG: TetR/AcrR family transcriptional regulator [Solirubrobacterales bacterium]|nr:TetR/AcrR family transcriptional regulator [Solirubrobacterales bacterium]MCB8914705.1 TetR/AcrR family transcriptional regulator [Thermoleophilales bacterium]